MLIVAHVTNATAVHAHVTILQAIILGVAQGFTEFAPVSSSGHLIILPWLFNWDILNDPSLNKTFDVALHVGTFVGAVVYFRHDLAHLFRAWTRSIRHRAIQQSDERMAWFLIVGSIPGALLGVAFESTIEHSLGQPWLIAFMMAAGGVVLYVVDRVAPSGKGTRDITWPNAIGIGVAQAVALQPGVSRSGITITTARAMGIKRDSAARFSFLLSLPIIGGAALLKTVQLAQDGMPAGLAQPFFWGMVSSAISGYLVIAWLLRYLKTKDFLPFMIYRLVLAAGMVIVIVTGLRPATI
jgi:undecaprenyl-diphosphatase